MKIAILSTPWIAIPPKGYGGIESVVNNLTEELVKRGHEVYLFATGDSKTKAKLFFYYKKSLGNNLYLKQIPYIYLLHINSFLELCQKEKFDIIHNNFQYAPMFFLEFTNTPFIHTLHGAYYKTLTSPTLHNTQLVSVVRQTLQKFHYHPYISISNNQREGLKKLNYIRTIYNGVDPKNFNFHKKSGNYLAWLGRITPNKGLDIAIKIAKKIKIPLKIAGFIDPGDRDYFEKKIKPLLDKNVEFFGEIKTPKEKSDFFGNALATLFPIRWHEPFGIVMLESMVCGTPIIAFNKGSVPEVVKNGETGFIVENEEEMIQKIEKVKKIKREKCREHVIKNFTVEKMTSDYLEAYQIAINSYPYR